jgi:hypothetical protein
LLSATMGSPLGTWEVVGAAGCRAGGCWKGVAGHTAPPPRHRDSTPAPFAPCRASGPPLHQSRLHMGCACHVCWVLGRMGGVPFGCWGCCTSVCRCFQPGVARRGWMLASKCGPLSLVCSSPLDGVRVVPVGRNGRIDGVHFPALAAVVLHFAVCGHCFDRSRPASVSWRRARTWRRPL